MVISFTENGFVKVELQVQKSETRLGQSHFMLRIGVFLTRHLWASFPCSLQNKIGTDIIILITKMLGYVYLIFNIYRVPLYFLTQKNEIFLISTYIYAVISKKWSNIRTNRAAVAVEETLVYIFFTKALHLFPTLTGIVQLYPDPNRYRPIMLAHSFVIPTLWGRGIYLS